MGHLSNVLSILPASPSGALNVSSSTSWSSLFRGSRNLVHCSLYISSGVLLETLFDAIVKSYDRFNPRARTGRDCISQKLSKRTNSAEKLQPIAYFKFVKELPSYKGRKCIGFLFSWC